MVGESGGRNRCEAGEAWWKKMEAGICVKLGVVGHGRSASVGLLRMWYRWLHLFPEPLGVGPCTRVQLHGCATAWVCNCMGVQLHGCATAWVCNCMGVQLHGCAGGSTKGFCKGFRVWVSRAAAFPDTFHAKVRVTG
eukprot:357215-Chlamydomonas_euryale.AAC.2